MNSVTEPFRAVGVPVLPDNGVTVPAGRPSPPLAKKTPHRQCAQQPQAGRDDQPMTHRTSGTCTATNPPQQIATMRAAAPMTTTEHAAQVGS